MSGGNRNTGIHQTGSGRIDNSGPIAVGDGAQARGGAPGPSPSAGELTPQQALDALRALLAEHGSDLTDEDRARARGELAEVTDQLAAPEPDPGRIARILGRLTAALSSVTALAVAADRLREAVSRAIG
ncbi:hypothetical protein GA0115240_138213 [Streptomyces sp. DvalAA-14]|uniref:DUF5955 family protein n=1 Tax=unclassified Streptomyces TaxID=2593676 RepID=UPI00081B3BEE|nr:MULTISPECIES: DUF5955 family protein [unclassified Streptomyces]MYS22105.1 hypothetical protein [Streptomyces sp. SID4948]SCE08730.1 hypothetical protein GA0115240_138213 [Streptomyces sp. DvalAA-14]